MTKGLNQTFGHFTFSPILNNIKTYTSMTPSFTRRRI